MDAAAQAADNLGVKAVIVQCLRVVRAHRSRFVFFALASAFAMLVVWLSSPRPAPEGDDASTPAAAQRAEAATTTPVTPTAEPAALEPAPIAEGGALEKVEVCGIGWVDADADGAVDTQALLGSAPMADASARLLESVRGDGDFGAATALAIPLASLGEGTVSLLSVEAVCAAGPCDATTQDRATAASLVDQLVRLASATSDPRVYSLALELCAWQRRDGSCAVLNTAQWARLDPDNGLPWLYRLDEAVARRDTSAIDDALFHIGAAPRLDGRLLVESNFVARHAGAAPAELFVAERLAATVGSLRGMGGPRALSAVSRTCSVGALSESNRRELCEKAATALQERAGSVLTMATGSAIGRRLGWPDERFADADAIVAAHPDALPIGLLPLDVSHPAAAQRAALDCASIRRRLRYIEEVATFGEREQVRRWLERSGRTDEYLRLGRVQRARIVERDAAEAAQRAAAPAR